MKIVNLKLIDENLELKDHMASNRKLNYIFKGLVIFLEFSKSIPQANRKTKQKVIMVDTLEHKNSLIASRNIGPQTAHENEDLNKLNESNSSDKNKQKKIGTSELLGLQLSQGIFNEENSEFKGEWTILTSREKLKPPFEVHFEIDYAFGDGVVGICSSSSRYIVPDDFGQGYTNMILYNFGDQTVRVPWNHKFSKYLIKDCQDHSKVILKIDGKGNLGYVVDEIDIGAFAQIDIDKQYHIYLGIRGHAKIQVKFAVW